MVQGLLWAVHIFGGTPFSSIRSGEFSDAGENPKVLKHG